MIILSAIFVLLNIFSWLLLFRNDTALKVILRFYPGLGNGPEAVRIFLVHHGLNSLGTVVVGLLLGLGFWAYFRAIKNPPGVKTILIGAVVFLLIMFFAYPVLSTDIYDYILFTRLAVHYGQNVWMVTPATAIPSDVFYNLASWQKSLDAYGILNILIYSPAELLSGGDLVRSLVLYKLVSLFFAFGSIAVSLKILKEFFPKNLEKGLLMVFWNPLYIIEISGSGHNDSLMIFFFLLGFYLLLKKRYLFSAIAVSSAAQIKFVPLVFLCLASLYLLKNRGLKAFLKFTIAGALANILGFWLIGLKGTENILLKGNGAVYWQSLPMLIHDYLFIHEQPVFQVVAGLLGLFLLYKVWGKGLEPLTAYIVFLLIYLLFLTSVYWNWYILWLLPLTPFIGHKRLVMAVLVFTATSALIYPLYWLSLRFMHQNPVWPVIIYLVLVGPVIISWIYGKNYQKI